MPHLEDPERAEARPSVKAGGRAGGDEAFTSALVAADPVARRRAATTCGWCGAAIQPKARGRIPTWCSPACRQRAWEQARAAASGRSAVKVVERRVEVRVPATPTRRDWARLLDELAHQIQDGRVYDRDLPELAAALRHVLDAYGRRPHVRDRGRRGTLPNLQ
jgi:hypothetical protein